MMHLTDSFRNYPLMIKTITNKGYQFWIDDNGSFWAEKDGWDFVADDLAGLLGVIAIYEYKKPKEFRERWWEK
ncbi:hypothetical protein SAMN02745664_12126 [Moraxella cuniculi DSM 21768]|uniref:Uncharacterized protein n=1 Tax=Moraxella cuniculi DSM 21768 TaxID=1122245 RepID=A0A1N7G169_9GAMM|nr:hypothetical protein [Moraxella cuniculi]OOS07805.1 hypothetical protein B0189_01995 [Moraxella cuniculi]SIS06295.1 hypothetical protein SAMN02745664_12126 [Moraxella cuniculi DSM 21768]